MTTAIGSGGCRDHLVDDQSRLRREVGWGAEDVAAELACAELGPQRLKRQLRHRDGRADSEVS
ncbi:hypothetical protein [Actinomadura rudentiformis]|uniref:Uncharacterized protein n=1 Tax=Actinomadura rudentiformis TaxID=359158 RepID=A0A6H9Y5M7_9ACTN|nr:hypothetical protein [Actinomadura rudentiformis]KAB2339309.1 hypothetical protein F8566_48250 [Actinomadura rudentiformis]